MVPFLYFTVVVVLLFLALRLTVGTRIMGANRASGSAQIPIVPLGWALGLFLVATYLICVVFDLIFPGFAMNQSWSGLLPGFVWLTPLGFIVGLIESFLYGWFVALIFGGLFNVFAFKEASA